MVLPDDVKELAQPLLGHRLLLHAEAQFDGVTVDEVIEKILADVAPPVERG
jgi:MoxR-like ATPase